MMLNQKRATGHSAEIIIWNTNGTSISHHLLQTLRVPHCKRRRKIIRTKVLEDPSKTVSSGHDKTLELKAALVPTQDQDNQHSSMEDAVDQLLTNI